MDEGAITSNKQGAGETSRLAFVSVALQLWHGNELVTDISSPGGEA